MLVIPAVHAAAGLPRDASYEYLIGAKADRSMSREIISPEPLTLRGRLPQWLGGSY